MTPQGSHETTLAFAKRRAADELQILDAEWSIAE